MVVDKLRREFFLYDVEFEILVDKLRLIVFGGFCIGKFIIIILFLRFLRV